jgi:hypothetical protein
MISEAARGVHPGELRVGLVLASFVVQGYCQFHNNESRMEVCRKLCVVLILASFAV